MPEPKNQMLGTMLNFHLIVCVKKSEPFWQKQFQLILWQCPDLAKPNNQHVDPGPLSQNFNEWSHTAKILVLNKQHWVGVKVFGIKFVRITQLTVLIKLK